jgi:hypothetical protein
MYNLTNVDEVVYFSATPVYKVVGPYMYRRFRHVRGGERGALFN